MLERAAVIAFVATTDLERTRKFYGGVLGLTLTSDDPYGLMFDANGTALRLAKVDTLSPAPYTVLGWEVADIEAAAAGLGARGIELERFEGMAQDSRGIWTVPDGGKVAWFKDPDGNLLSLTQTA